VGVVSLHVLLERYNRLTRRWVVIDTYAPEELPAAIAAQHGHGVAPVLAVEWVLS
jgi:hypothetical protein